MDLLAKQLIVRFFFRDKGISTETANWHQALVSQN
jgi:hypothetical protein